MGAIIVNDGAISVLDGAIVLDDNGVDCCCGDPSPTEACCFNDDTCQDLTPQACTDNLGMPQGAGTVCANIDCGDEGCAAFCPPNTFVCENNYFINTSQGARFIITTPFGSCDQTLPAFGWAIDNAPGGLCVWHQTPPTQTAVDCQGCGNVPGGPIGSLIMTVPAFNPLSCNLNKGIWELRMDWAWFGCEQCFSNCFAPGVCGGSMTWTRPGGGASCSPLGVYNFTGITGACDFAGFSFNLITPGVIRILP